MRGSLPTVALTPSRVPEPDAANTDVIRFAQTLNGYEHVTSGELAVLARRFKAGEGDSLSLQDLRLALFATQRAHYHQGGGWPGEVDTLLERMREIVGVLRQRIEAQPPTVGVWRGDITTLDVDAIVNAANETLLGGGGVDGAIHRAAGPDLAEACRQFPVTPPDVRCSTGEARLTRGFELPAGHVVHAVGPRWQGGGMEERPLLASAYRESLSIATDAGFESVAFPAISTGVYGFPADQAAQIAVDVVRAWQAAIGSPDRVVLVAFDEDAERVLRAALADASGGA